MNKNFQNLFEAVNDSKLRWLDQLYLDTTAAQKTKKLNDESKFAYIKMQLGGSSAPQGSSRMVISFDDSHVIKIALNAAGFAQNGTEATIGNDPAVEDVVVPVVGWSDVTDYDGFFWILVKKVKPLSDDLVGKDWEIFSAALRKTLTSDDPVDMKFSDDTKVEIPRGAAEKRKKEIENIRKNRTSEPSEIFKHVSQDFFEAFKNFANRYAGSRTGDLFKPDSWGIDNNKLKLIDYGFTRRIANDFYLGGYFAGSEKAQSSSMQRAVERSKNVRDTLASNIDLISNIKSIPPNLSLMLLLKGIVLGLPPRIEKFEIGDSLTPLKATEIEAAARTLRDNERKVDTIIRQVSDETLRARVEEEFENLMLAQGSLNANESLVRRLVREVVRHYKR